MTPTHVNEESSLDEFLITTWSLCTTENANTDDPRMMPTHAVAKLKAAHGS